MTPSSSHPYKIVGKWQTNWIEFPIYIIASVFSLICYLICFFLFLVSVGPFCQLLIMLECPSLVVAWLGWWWWERILQLSLRPTPMTTLEATRPHTPGRKMYFSFCIFFCPPWGMINIFFAAWIARRNVGLRLKGEIILSWKKRCDFWRVKQCCDIWIHVTTYFIKNRHKKGWRNVCAV